MNYPFSHHVSFDDRGRLRSEQRLSIPPSDLPNGFTLDIQLAEQLN